MTEYDEVELIADQPQWQMLAGAQGAVVDAMPGENVVSIEFYGPDEENTVHLVPVDVLRVTDHAVRRALAETAAPHP